ncbi:TOMM precursor leader peptide-binding protein [Lentzea aerocolonigenes]|uniref:TOMM precursor leader peptide-binding protein n=1 Tax=Lentzea aerocolonigenes TaxID=68170 RepID=UPI0004C374AA|nr:TOMM precursor leader peptide-binding protein [Lentzea aerocolonigenes]MCP2245400.1 ribosomal protein S12 methylthiotransferase accessory factor [Lentzea aerocolonigenes]
MTSHHIGFKRHLRAEVVPGDAVYVFSEEDTTALRGPHVEALAPLLDGSRDLAAVRRELDASPEHAAGLLTQLAQAGLVGVRTSGSAYWDAVGVEPVGTPDVDVITLGIDAELPPIAEGDGSLTVVLVSDYLVDGLSEVDDKLRAAGRPWLLAKPVGAKVFIGPFFTPGSGPCYHCLSHRLWANRAAEAHVSSALGLPGAIPRPPLVFEPLQAVALNLVALEAAKWVAGHRYDGQRAVWTFDSRDLTGRRHAVSARPQCRSCGDPALVSEQARRPVALTSRPKVHTAGGGHRSSTPEEVLAAYRHLISPVTGVVRDVVRDDRGPAFFNAFLSGPNLALGSRGAAHLRSALRSQNGGKGVTALDAEVGALCEALERHSAHADGDEERVRGSYRSLGAQAIHPDDVQLYDPRQFDDRASWNAAHSDFQHVCAPFDEGAEIDWTPVWSLTRGEHRFLPTGLLYFDADPDERLMADSNGNAAGSSLEDAVLQGMLELVERDAAALWWYNRTSQPPVDLAGDPWIDSFRSVHADLGREVWALDLTSDLGVPVVVALSRQTSGEREDIMMGFGAHLDPALALRRALTEVNQMMPSVLAGGWADDPDLRHWLSTATVANQPYLLPSGSPVQHSYTASDDLLTDLLEVQARLEKAGLEVFVLDQTRPDIGLPVVKVIVPGLRGFWARFAPGRLFDVPVRLGRVASPTPYDELNPIAIFL